MPGKFLTLMNPRRRRRSRRLFGAALAAHQRKVGRHRVRRNPVRRRRHRRRYYAARCNPVRRASPPKMTPAMRAKISRAVKAANRRRRSGGGVRRSVVRFASRSPSRSRRRFSVGRFGGNALSSFRSMASRPMLMKAAGAVGASFATGWLLNRYSNLLPMSTNKYGRIAYSVGIPFLGAYLIRKRSRDLAEGMVIGGLVMGINALIQNFAPAVAATAQVAATGAYPIRFPSNKVAGELGFQYYPKRAGSLGTPLRTGAAFRSSAWTR